MGVHLDLININSCFGIFNLYFNSRQYAAYVQMGKLDSADYYFRRPEPQAEGKAGPFMKAELYDELGDFYRRKSDLRKASLYYLKERGIGQATGDLKLSRDADSLRNLSRETDLLKLEVDNDSRRREREAKEEEQATEHRHNVQYTGFTVGLVVLFIVLVMMGWRCRLP